jgi:hypothetical protein
MKNKALSAVVCIIALALAASAQKVGGYQEIPKADASAQAAAIFAVSTKAEELKKTIELTSVLKAERQVVAGTNFRLCLKIKFEEIVTLYMQAIVHVDPKGNKKLTSWTTTDCGEDED